MRKLALATVLALSPCLALAEEDPVIALWGSDSGSLPPEYAWDYTVRFHASGLVEVEYCKGYSEAPPGCATVKKDLSEEDRSALLAELDPLAQDLAAKPPKRAADDEIPIGGGSDWGSITVDGTEITLYSYPAAADVERVQNVLAILKKYTPTKLIAKAERRAKQP